MPAISISVSVAADRPAENSFSHFAQPGAAFSQVLRSSDFVVASAVLETGFSEGISFPAHVRRPLSNRTYRARLANFVTKNLNSARCSKSISGTDRPDYRCTFWPRQVGAARNNVRSKLVSAWVKSRHMQCKKAYPLNRITTAAGLIMVQSVSLKIKTR